MMVNRGAIAITNSAQEASAIRGGAEQLDRTVTIDNSGALTAVSGGTGERNDVTAGIVVTSASGRAANVTNIGDQGRSKNAQTDAAAGNATNGIARQ